MTDPSPPVASNCGPASFTHAEILRILCGAALGIFIAALDFTIVGTALPTIAGDLHDAAHVSWTVSIFMLTAAAATPIFGKLSDLYGRRRLIDIAAIIFILGSVCCAMAPGMGGLIAARALQGIGGGALATLSQTVIGDVVSPRERGRYQGYFAAVWLMGASGGPIIGGLLVDLLSWRWIFWINIPLGFLLLAITGTTLKRLQQPRRLAIGRPKIDYLGAVLFIAGLTALLLVTSWGGNDYAWDSPVILGLLGSSIVLLVLFALQELRASEAILPPRLFGNPVFLTSITLSLLSSAASLGVIVFLPSFLQLVGGRTASDSGLLLLPMMMAQPIAGGIAGRIIMRTGRYKFLLLIGSAAAAVAFLGLSRVTAATPLPMVEVLLAVAGGGIGLTGPVIILAAQNAVDWGDLGTATASVALFRTMGGSLAVALLGAIIYAGLRQAGGAAANLAITPNALLQGGAAAIAGLPEPLRDTFRAGIIAAFQNCFLAAAGFAALFVLAGWFLKELPLRTTRQSAESERAVPELPAAPPSAE